METQELVTARRLWWSVADTLAWIAWRGEPEPADTGAGMTELQRAERDLVERAGDGLVRARGVSGKASSPRASVPTLIPPEAFCAEDVGLHMDGGMGLRFRAPLDRIVGPRAYDKANGPEYHSVELAAGDVRREWPPITKAAGNMKAETAMSNWLAAQMREARTSPIAKPEMRARAARALGFDVSDTAFNSRVWPNAVDLANAPLWRQAGRRRKEKSEG